MALGEYRICDKHEAQGKRHFAEFTCIICGKDFCSDLESSTVHGICDGCEEHIQDRDLDVFEEIHAKHLAAAHKEIHEWIRTNLETHQDKQKPKPAKKKGGKRG